MSILGKKELLSRIVRAIESSGWDITLLGSLNAHPLKIRISNGSEEEKLIVYVWNITHGGKTRSEDEFRIQITGVKQLSFEEGFKTLLLGVAEVDGQNVFVAFNPFIHARFGFSPSIQVSRKALVEAVNHGMAFHEKSSRSKTGGLIEVVVAFSPSQITEYITKVYSEYHEESISEISKTEADFILKNPLDSKISIVDLARMLQGLPPKRKKVIQQLLKAVRNGNFKPAVLKAYEAKCAICGLQGKLTEGCHIVDVEFEGSDELNNGVSLCRNHHKAFDAGLVAISEDYTILINKAYVQKLRVMKLDGELDRFIKESRIGEKIFLPNDKSFYPKKEYLKSKLELKGVKFFL